MQYLQARSPFPKIDGCLAGGGGVYSRWLSTVLLLICLMALLLIPPTDPPYISKAKNTGVSVGQKGILSCEASAVPMAEFQWFKEDTRYLESGNGACLKRSWWVVPHAEGGWWSPGGKYGKTKLMTASIITEPPFRTSNKKQRKLGSGQWDRLCFRIWD